MARVYGATRATILSVNGRAYTGPGLSGFELDSKRDIGIAYELPNGTLYKKLIRRRRTFKATWELVTESEMQSIISYFPCIAQSNKAVDNNDYIITYPDFGSSQVASSRVYVGDSLKIKIVTAAGTPDSRCYSVSMPLIEIE